MLFLPRFESQVLFLLGFFGANRFAHIGDMNWIAQFANLERVFVDFGSLWNCCIVYAK